MSIIMAPPGAYHMVTSDKAADGSTYWCAGAVFAFDDEGHPMIMDPYGKQLIRCVDYVRNYNSTASWSVAPAEQTAIPAHPGWVVEMTIEDEAGQAELCVYPVVQWHYDGSGDGMGEEVTKAICVKPDEGDLAEFVLGSQDNMRLRLATRAELDRLMPRTHVLPNGP